MPIVDVRNPSTPFDAEWAPKIRNLQLRRTLMPPNMQSLHEASQGFGFANATAKFNLTQYKLYQATAQVNTGQILSSVGIPRVIGFAKSLPTTKMFGDVLNALDVDPVRMIEDGLDELYGSIGAAEGAMSGAIENLSGAIDSIPQVLTGWEEAAPVVNNLMSNVVGNMGIYGRIIKIVYNLGKSIYRFVKWAKEISKEEEVLQGKAVQYSPDLDWAALEDVTDLLNSTHDRDWTRLFLPPAIRRPSWGGDRFSEQKLAEPKGMLRISPVNYSGDDSQIGFVPGGHTFFGDPVIHKGIQIYRPGDSITDDVGTILFPSTLQQISWVWTHIMGGTQRPWPAMYTVNTDVMIDMWSAYIDELHFYIRESKKLNREQKLMILDRYKPIFGWMTRLDTAGPHENFRPVKAAMRLRERQEYFLKYSLMCAYVNDITYPAIRDSFGLRAQWANLRHILLTHEERCEVDIANIPDLPYRQQMKQARGIRDCRPMDLAISEVPRRDPTKPWRRPGRGPDSGPDNVPEPPEALGPYDGHSVTGRSSNKIAIAAFAALAYAGWRFRR